MDEREPQALHARVTVLEAAVRELQEFRSEIKADIRELRRGLSDTQDAIADLKSALHAGLQDVRDRLGAVLTGAFNSLPPWASAALVVAGLLVGGLGVYATVHP